MENEHLAIIILCMFTLMQFVLIIFMSKLSNWTVEIWKGKYENLAASIRKSAKEGTL